MATLDLGYKVDSYFHYQHQSPISTSFLGVETPPSYCFSHFHKNILTILLKSVFIILWNAIKTAYLIYFVFLRLMHFFLLLMTSLSILLGWPLLPTLCPCCSSGVAPPKPRYQNLPCFGHYHPQWFYDWFMDGHVYGNRCEREAFFFPVELENVNKSFLGFLIRSEWRDEGREISDAFEVFDSFTFNLWTIWFHDSRKSFFA